jgi:hypothetical protein
MATHTKPTRTTLRPITVDRPLVAGMGGQGADPTSAVVQRRDRHPECGTDRTFDQAINKPTEPQEVATELSLRS